MVLYISGGAGFLPSTVAPTSTKKTKLKLFQTKTIPGKNSVVINTIVQKSHQLRLVVYATIRVYLQCVTVDGRNPAPPGMMLTPCKLW